MDTGTVVDIEVETVDPEEALAVPPVYTGLNIYQRLALVTAGVGRIEKDGTIEIGKGKYDYISHDAVSYHIRLSVVACGIAVVPTVLECTKDGNRTEMRVQVEFVCIDDPESRVAVESIGYGVDSTDKGPGKAYSYAVKYAYMKIFMLNSADDTQSDEHDPDSKRVSDNDANDNVTVEQLKVWADNFNLAISGAKTPEEINKLQKANTAMLLKAPEVTREFFVTKIQGRKAALADAEKGETEGSE